MSLNDAADLRMEHPVDMVERVASSKQWTFERADEDEISISVAGGWSDYHVNFTWLEDMDSLHIGAAFDLKVPDGRRAEILKLVSFINEQLWVGHFDLWPAENAVMFRHALLLPGGMVATSGQCESMLKIAVEACERYYQAFQFVVWAGKGAREALSSAIFDTVGEA